MDYIQTNKLGTKLIVYLYIALLYTHELQCLYVIHKEVKRPVHLLFQRILAIWMKCIVL